MEFGDRYWAFTWLNRHQSKLTHSTKKKKKKLDKEGSSYSPLERPRSAIAE